MSIMALATKITAKVVYDKELEFSLLFTPMSTQEYTFMQEILVKSLFPIFVWALLGISDSLMEQNLEEKKEKVSLMLDKIG